MGELMSYKVTLQTTDKKHTLVNIIHNASKEEAIKFCSNVQGFMDAEGNDHDEPLFVVDVERV